MPLRSELGHSGSTVYSDAAASWEREGEREGGMVGSTGGRKRRLHTAMCACMHACVQAARPGLDCYVKHIQCWRSTDAPTLTRHCFRSAIKAGAKVRPQISGRLNLFMSQSLSSVQPSRYEIISLIN